MEEDCEVAIWISVEAGTYLGVTLQERSTNTFIIPVYDGCAKGGNKSKEREHEKKKRENVYPLVTDFLHGTIHFPMNSCAVFEGDKRDGPIWRNYVRL